MKSNSLQVLLLERLNDLYNAETQLAGALPDLAQCAQHELLKQYFLDHLDVTRHQAARLEVVFSRLDTRAETRTSETMGDLLAEASSIINTGEPGKFRDPELIAIAQRIQHYEISAYGTACAFAQALSKESITGLLQATHDEEIEADRRLATVAELLRQDARSNAAEF